MMWSRLFLVAALPALCLAINVPYEFRLRVDSVNGIAVNDLTPQLQIEYYTVDDCLPLRGQESDPLSFNSSLVSVADWSSEPLRLLGILDTKSDLLCIKFAVVDVSPTTNSGKRETVAKYSINTRLFKNYFETLESEMQWVYADDRGANTSYIYYTTKVSYSVNVRDLISETTVSQRGDVAAAVLLTTLGVSLIIELIDYFVLSDPVKRKERNGCSAAIIIMRGTLWMFFGGLWTAILYVLIGALLMVSLVGIPFGLKLMKISVMILLPFERDMIEDELSENRFRLSLTANIIWIAMGGAILSIMHLACAIILIMTILGIPFAMEQIKLARVALAPFGKTVVRLEGKRFGHFTDHVLKHTASEGDVNQTGHNVDDVEKELAGHGGKSNF